MSDLNKITEQIIQAAIRVHRELGPGLLESVYQRCMEIELRAMGLRVISELPLKVTYRGIELKDDAFRIDLLVEEQVVVELKSVEEVKAVHKKQLLTYLKLSGKPLGLLINFNEVLLKHGITRIINQKIETQALAESS